MVTPVNSGPTARLLPSLLLAVVLGATLAACSTAAGPRGRRLSVVAAENTWGSLARQLGGRRVEVTSIITDPNADPHEFETNAADARAFAEAHLVIVNGAGYDGWALKLLQASPGSHRHVLDIGRLLGKGPGANPHFWYDPGYVKQVIEAITRQYVSLRPTWRHYFEQRRVAVTRAFAGYERELALIRHRYAGRPVGATESIFVYLAHYLRLRLVSPRAFMLAMSEGTDPPAESVATFARQIDRHRLAVLVYNAQTVNPLTTELRSQAVAHHIEVVAVSETIDPPQLTYEAWMTRQLTRLERALSRSRR